MLKELIDLLSKCLWWFTLFQIITRARSRLICWHFDQNVDSDSEHLCLSVSSACGNYNWAFVSSKWLRTACHWRRGPRGCGRGT